MKLIVLTLGLGLGACLVVAVGIFGAVEAGLLMRRLVGPEYELWAFWGALLAVAGVAFGLYRWQDAVLGWLGPLVGRPAPEIMFCQTCGTPSRHDVPFCPSCGGTRFGIAKPDAAGRGARWRVQVGMDVVASDGQQLGVIKRKRSRDFLVARPLKRDVYIPTTTVARSDKTAVHLTVTSEDPTIDAWTRSDLLGRAPR